MFKQAHKAVFSLILAVSVAISMAACGKETTGDSSTSTTAPVSTSAAPETTTQKVSGDITIVTQIPEYEELVGKFKKDYPDIKLTWNQDSKAPDVQKIRLAAGGEGMDLLTPQKNDYPVMAEAGQLLDLTGKEFLDNYVAQAIESTKIDGKVFGVPATQQVYVVWYNKDIFEKNGITEPKSWEDFMAACDKLKAANIPAIVAAGKNFPFFEGVLTYNTLFSKDSEWLSKVKKGEVKWTDPDSINALKNYENLFANGYVLQGALSTDDVQAYQAFYQGKAAMFPNGAWSIDKIIKTPPTFKLGAFPLPVENGVEARAQSTYGTTFAGVAQSKNIEAATAFIQWLSQKENAQLYSDVGAIYSPVKGTTAKFSEYSKLLDPIFSMPKTYMMHSTWSPSVSSIINSEFQKLIDSKATKSTPELMAKALQEAQDKDIKK